MTNILTTLISRAESNLQVKIIDFGLAKDIQVILISALKILDCSEIQGERGTVAPTKK